MAEMFEENTDQESGGTEQDSGQQFDAAYVAKLRTEAARYRNEAKAAKTQLTELQPLAQKAKELEEAQQTEAEKLAQKMADLQNQLTTAQAAATQAAQAQKLTTLAAKVGVPADVLPLLDVSKFDLENEEQTIEMLGALKPQKTPPNGGGSSNPPQGDNNGAVTPQEWYNQRLGKNPSIFGG